jgi:hypothetical protein
MAISPNLKFSELIKDFKADFKGRDFKNFGFTTSMVDKEIIY